MLEQTEYLLKLGGSQSPSDQQRLSDIKEQVAAVKSLTMESSAKLVLGAPPAYWIDLRGYSPPESAKSLKQPLLVLQGERDYQVTMQDYANWRNALESRDNICGLVAPFIAQPPYPDSRLRM